MAINWFGGSAYPTRGGSMPQSGQVMSDGEFNQGWQDKLATIPQYLTTETPEWLNVSDVWRSGDLAQIDQLMKYTSNPDQKFSFGSTATDGFGAPTTDYRIQTGTSSVSELNPEWSKLNDTFQTAKNLRAENQTRQQQAYDTTMMGNGAFGGVLPSNYADPNYGQVTGQKTGGLGGLGGTDLTGIGNENQTGAYGGGSGSYNPTPWAAGWQGNKGWGGF